ncbi:MAG: hypothetical protein ABIH89_07470 [Elusimicrobiota bacterium]
MKSLLFRFLLILFISLFPDILPAATWTQTGETAFAEGETDGTEIYGTGADALIRLNTTESVEWGNDFMVEEQETFDLVSNAVFAARFRASRDLAVTKLWICMDSKVLVPPLSMPEYHVGLQANDNSNNYPANVSGVWLSSGTIAPGFPPLQGWQAVTLASQCQLTKGTTYHLVIKYKSGTIDGNHYMQVYGTKPENNKLPYDNSVDEMSERLSSNDSGATWIPLNEQPIFVLETADGDYEGNPYTKIDEDVKVFDTDFYVGEKIAVTGGDKTVKKFSFYVRSNVSSPVNDLYVVLQDVTGGSILETTAIDKTKVAAYYKEYEHSFKTTHVLKNGNEYRIYLKSPSSTTDNCYIIKKILAYQDAPEKTNQALISATYMGADACYTSYNGTLWTETTCEELIFKFQSVTFSSSGRFVSKVYDAGNPAEFSQISWEPLTQSASTELIFQVASSDSSAGPWSYLGPDGTSSSYYTQPSGEDISSIHTGKRYIAYKAYFTTPDTGYTPQLEKVSISYEARALRGTELELYNTPNPFEAGKQSTSIRYILDTDCKVTVNFYTPTGNLVKKMTYAAGSEGGRGETGGYENTITWDGKNGNGVIVANGVYFCHIVAEPSNGTAVLGETRKIAVIK